MPPPTPPKRSSSYRHSLMTFSWMGASKACPIGCSAQLLRPEDVLEQPLPFLLLVPAEDSGNDFSVLQPLAHIGGIYRHVVAGLAFAAPGGGRLPPPAWDESSSPQTGLVGRAPRNPASQAAQRSARTASPN